VVVVANQARRRQPHDSSNENFGTCVAATCLAMRGAVDRNSKKRFLFERQALLV
jgi:hypothetical protein